MDESDRVDEDAGATCHATCLRFGGVVELTEATAGAPFDAVAALLGNSDKFSARNFDATGLSSKRGFAPRRKTLAAGLSNNIEDCVSATNCPVARVGDEPAYDCYASLKDFSTAAAATWPVRVYVGWSVGSFVPVRALWCPCQLGMRGLRSGNTTALYRVCCLVVRTNWDVCAVSCSV